MNGRLRRGGVIPEVPREIPPLSPPRGRRDDMGARAPQAGAIVPHAPLVGHVRRNVDCLREIAFDYAWVLREPIPR